MTSPEKSRIFIAPVATILFVNMPIKKKRKLISKANIVQILWFSFIKSDIATEECQIPFYANIVIWIIPISVIFAFINTALEPKLIINEGNWGLTWEETSRLVLVLVKSFDDEPEW